MRKAISKTETAKMWESGELDAYLVEKYKDNIDKLYEIDPVLAYKAEEQKLMEEQYAKQIAGRDNFHEGFEDGSGFQNVDLKQKIGELKGKAAKLNDEQWGKAVSYVAKKLCPGVEDLSEKQKREIFKRDLNQTVGILLHEFESSTGPQKREFGPDDALTKKIMKHNSVEEALNEFYLSNKGRSESDKLDPITGYKYKFSPNLEWSELFNIPKSTVEHVDMFKELFNEKECSMLFLGGVTVKVQPTSKNKELQITVENATDKNSLMLHQAKSVDREGKTVQFGTIEQNFRYTVPLDRKRLGTEQDKSIINRIREKVKTTREQLNI